MLRGDRNWISKGELCCKLFPSVNKNSCQQWRRVAEATYLLMYSPVRTFPQALHLKHPRCHCLSRASNACPFFMSLPQPAQSANKQTNAFAVSYLVHWCSLTTQQLLDLVIKGENYTAMQRHIFFLSPETYRSSMKIQSSLLQTYSAEDRNLYPVFHTLWFKDC